MHEGFAAAAELLPEEMRKSLSFLNEKEKSSAEEIRLRLGWPPGIVLPDGEKSIGSKAVNSRDIAAVLERATRASMHSVGQELCRGYISAPGGIRLGVCGTAAGESMRDISSLALRIPHEVKGAGGEIMDSLCPFDSSVLIISPPGGGKTTFLRELIRRASYRGTRVCVCDERCEIAAMHGGKSVFDLGPHTDVLSGKGKAEGICMLLRAMNPEIIALDEISAETDCGAMEQALGCGATIFATAHGKSIEDLKRRRAYAKLLETGIFQRAVLISGRGGREYTVVELC